MRASSEVSRSVAEKVVDEEEARRAAMVDDEIEGGSNIAENKSVSSVSEFPKADEDENEAERDAEE